ncbi:ferritin-like domain-containing protein [Bradyrhizobium sp. Rc2d]|uniref:ferritin-like domain-containing protein n=1 Tax=Bradyrhizobium sp. Rc2d TaxID=1855321 RepID=UPI001FCDE32A|nr:ferritin-like domain-containing protein [Bradyrhizobium sp. Rc2d]
MQGPDGAIVEFPAGTSHEEMTTALRKHYGVPAQPPLPPLPPGYKLDPPAAVPRLAENELAHVRFYRKTLGRTAVSRPAIDFDAGIKAAAQAAGLPADFDPFADDMSVLLGGMLFEDVGVTAYAGAAPLIKSKEFVEAAAGILAVEAYHMGMARSQLYLMGEKAWNAANGISDARDQLDGGQDKDQGIRMNGKANVVPSTPDAIAFRRTPQEVLHIVYLTEKQGVSKGGFYPNGMNGVLRST